MSSKHYLKDDECAECGAFEDLVFSEDLESDVCLGCAANAATNEGA